MKFLTKGEVTMKNLAVLISSLIISGSAFAWKPTKPVEVTVPFPPGSGNDVVIRPLAAAVERNTGVKFLIVNRPGAGGTVGSTSFVSKPNDGHHINIISTPGIAAMDYTWLAQLDKQPYSVTSFTYATALAQSPLVIVANKNDSVSTPEEFVKVLLTDKKVTIAHSGAANSLALETILLSIDAANKNPNIVKVEHRGPAESITDVMGGHVRFGAMPLSVAYANYKEGNLKIIGVVQQGKTRDSEIKTFASISKNIDVNLVWGIALPKDTPTEVLNWYAKAFREAQNDPSVKEVFEKNRYFSVEGLQTPESFTSYVLDLNKRHSRVVNLIIKNQKDSKK
jgi:tripartite-type tricarboxylate transporter receptor subunit TctC